MINSGRNLCKSEHPVTAIRRIQAHIKAMLIEAENFLGEGKSLCIARLDGNYIFRKTDGKIIFASSQNQPKKEPEFEPAIWFEETMEVKPCK